jgi:hypothetical protein
VTTWRVVLPYACYGVEVDTHVEVSGVVTKAAPIARWMVGQEWAYCQDWIARKGGTAEPL